jgi:hypothetical protein
LRTLPLALALALALAVISSAGRGNAASVAFDLSGLSAEEYRQVDGLALERRVALRLVQEGFAVMARGRGADVEVRAFMTPGGLALDASSGAASRRVTISTAEAPSPEWQLEVSHKISELARALSLASRPSRDSPAEPSSSGRQTAGRRARREPPAALAVGPRWELGLGAGAVSRQGGSDPLVGVSATNALGRLRLHLDIYGTWSSDSEIDILEAQGSAGIGMALVDGVVALDLGLAAGAVVHRFSLASSWVTEQSGTSASPAIWAPLCVRWASSRFFLSGRLAAGLTRTPTHTSQGATLWSRGSGRLEAMLIVGWAL